MSEDDKSVIAELREWKRLHESDPHSCIAANRRAEKAEAALDRATKALTILLDAEQCGRLMHEAWSKLVREQGRHGPGEHRYGPHVLCEESGDACSRYQPDLIPWDDLPEDKKAINRAALNAIIVKINEVL